MGDVDDDRNCMLDFQEFASYCKHIDQYANIVEQIDPVNSTRIEQTNRRPEGEGFRRKTSPDELVSNTSVGQDKRKDTRGGVNLMQKAF